MLHRTYLLLTACSACIALAAPAGADLHYVRATAAGANDGSSWPDAFTELQLALSAAQTGDQIWVAAGTYEPTPGDDRSVSFRLDDGIEVYGGFAGHENSRDERGVATRRISLGQLKNWLGEPD